MHFFLALFISRISVGTALRLFCYTVKPLEACVRSKGTIRPVKDRKRSPWLALALARSSCSKRHCRPHRETSIIVTSGQGRRQSFVAARATVSHSWEEGGKGEEKKCKMETVKKAATGRRILTFCLSVFFFFFFYPHRH